MATAILIVEMLAGEKTPTEAVQARPGGAAATAVAKRAGRSTATQAIETNGAASIPDARNSAARCRASPTSASTAAALRITAVAMASTEAKAVMAAVHAAPKTIARTGMT